MITLHGATIAQHATGTATITVQSLTVDGWRRSLAQPIVATFAENQQLHEVLGVIERQARSALAAEDRSRAPLPLPVLETTADDGHASHHAEHSEHHECHEHDPQEPGQVSAAHDRA